MPFHAQIAIARQPILDARQHIFAYELFYRHDVAALSAEIFDDVSATAQVIAGSLLEIGLDKLVGEHQAFINFPRAYLMNPSGVPIDKKQVIIEVDANVGFDPALLAALRKWSQAGFSLALDNFVFEAKLTPFVEIAQYIKLDFQTLGREQFLHQVAQLQGFDVRIIATKIETWDEFNVCKVVDISGFQGYFFERPELFSLKAARVNSMTLLQLMAELLRLDTTDIDKLDAIVSRDIGLVHKLLRYLNSPVSGLIAAVDSVRLAIVLIGVNQLKSLVNLLLMSEIVGDRYALLETVLIRAKHAELLAKDRGYDNTDTFFLAGMLSMMDVCMGVSLPTVLQQLPLPKEYINAIIERHGQVGDVLDWVEQYDKGHRLHSQLTIEQIKPSYLASVQWVDRFLAGL